MSTIHDRSVLAVDDDPAYLSVLKLCMRTCGFRSVYTAADGFAALEHLDSRRFDLIISDWNMAPMDGLELLRIVRGSASLAATPFILMTASLSELAWREAIQLGVDDFLLKPFSLTSLRAACHLASRSAGFDGGNVVPLRMRLKRKPAEFPDIEPAEAARTADGDAAPRPDDRPRPGWLARYEQILRLLTLTER